MTIENQAIHTDFRTVDETMTVEEAVTLIKESKVRLLVVQKEGKTIGVCDTNALFMMMDERTQKIPYSDQFATVTGADPTDGPYSAITYMLFLDEEDQIMGWQDAVSMENRMLKRGLSQDVWQLQTDLEAIVDSIYDEILVVDAQGIILRVSNRGANNLWGVHLATVVGKNILDLEEKGWFKPSVTRKVMNDQRKISIVQKNRFGRKILAVGNPIFNEAGNMERIVIASRDITEMTELKDELIHAKRLTEKYKQELDVLRNHQHHAEKTVIYKSWRMEEIMAQVERVSLVESTVIIYGESGVGKELIAQAIHSGSPRNGMPFIKINCGAIPDNLLESELFGYEKGAFSGASNQGKQGLLELAHEGTLFLDEIGELPLNLQVKLLRAIQEKEIMKVGGTQPIAIDVRIIAATNKNLEEMVRTHQFREDLYYRLHVIPLHIPALRERIEDVEPLVHTFLERFNHKFQTTKHFSEDAMEMFQAYDWPGNVRQLQNVIERAMVVTAGNLITANDLSKIISNRSANAQMPIQVHEIIPLKQAVEMAESQLIQLAINQYKTITKVAQVLEVSQPTLSRRFQKLFKNQD
ncbi:MAG: Fis family transcriptional regulator [Brevibacillus sp.]|nr:Fis family transcriptional regulator [Brevibacillus sp.]